MVGRSSLRTFDRCPAERRIHGEPAPSAVVGDAREVRFAVFGGDAEGRGLVNATNLSPNAGLILTHGRSNDMRNALLRRLSEAAADAGLWAMRINFRYVDAKAKASRDLSQEEEDLRGAVKFARTEAPSVPL